MKKLAAIILFSLAAVLFSAPPAAPAARTSEGRVSPILRQASTAYEAKDYEKVREILKPLVDKEEAYALFVMGLLAARGEGEERNLVTAEALWKKSASGGNAQAQFNLGYLYFTGAAGHQDLAAARENWSKAAKQRHPDALYGLGILQASGGGQADPEAAFRSFQAAAAFGHPMAEYEIGQAYLDGKGVRADPKKAREWLGKAARKGIPEAKDTLESMDNPKDGQTAEKQTQDKKSASRKSQDKKR